MAYRNLQVEILELFVESGTPSAIVSPTLRTVARVARFKKTKPPKPERFARAKRLKPPKPERVAHVPAGPPPRFNQSIGRAPILVTCFKCGAGLTSSDPRIVQAHVRACGVKQTRLPQRR